VSPPPMPVTAEDVARLRSEGIRRHGGEGSDRAGDEVCIDSAIGAALQAAYLLNNNDRIDPLHVASYLLFYIARNNCFADGNKRAAWLTCTDYLLRNGLVVNATQEEVYLLVLGIAKKQQTKEQVLGWMAEGGRLGPYVAEEEVEIIGFDD
jgi:death-on-curing protein